MALGRVGQTVYRWLCPHYGRTTVWFLEEEGGSPQVVATTVCDDCGKEVAAENDDQVRGEADRLLACVVHPRDREIQRLTAHL